jgi:DnaJ-class molecular chaperone
MLLLAIIFLLFLVAVVIAAINDEPGERCFACNGSGVSRNVGVRSNPYSCEICGGKGKLGRAH